MENKQWTMEEVFIFPEHAGLPAGVKSLKVTPGFTEKRTEDAVRLTGIYHVAANVEFAEGERAEGIPDATIFIDDVELAEDAGYFEYAVPLHIDLPPEVEGPLQVVTTNVTSESDGQGLFSIVWDVAVTQEEPVVVSVQEEPAIAFELEEQASPIAEAEVVQEEKSVAAIQEEEYVAFAPEEEVAIEKVTEAESVAQTATYNSTSYNNADEALSFIAGLEDGISTTSFRSNDVFVQNKS
ncbi:hypothetical protein MKY34_12595 [Sporosarcina sp. FSL K6-1522]|uniref:hypothetical protein n=1 Tax=Sporosarcina sp. FSL K6-1522 TaxID=2921554 RepID=UPI003159DD50